MRNCDDVEIGCEHVEALLDSSKKAEIRFKPARTLLRESIFCPAVFCQPRTPFLSERSSISRAHGTRTYLAEGIPLSSSLGAPQFRSVWIREGKARHGYHGSLTRIVASGRKPWHRETKKWISYAIGNYFNF